MAETAEKSRTKLSHKFTVEFGDDTMSNFMLASLRGIRIRGTWSKSRWHSNPKGAADMGPASAVPDMPGSRLEVDCRAMKGRLYDPLKGEDKGLLETYNRIAKDIPALKEGSAHSETQFTWNPDQLKSLLIEIKRFLDRGDAKLVGKSDFPTDDQIASAEGDQLFDQFNVSSVSKPKYSKDVDKWTQELEQRR